MIPNEKIKHDNKVLYKII